MSKKVEPKQNGYVNIGVNLEMGERFAGYRIKLAKKLGIDKVSKTFAMKLALNAAEKELAK